MSTKRNPPETAVEVSDLSVTLLLAGIRAGSRIAILDNGVVIGYVVPGEPSPAEEDRDVRLAKRQHAALQDLLSDLGKLPPVEPTNGTCVSEDLDDILYKPKED